MWPVWSVTVAQTTLDELDVDKGTSKVFPERDALILGRQVVPVVVQYLALATPL